MHSILQKLKQIVISPSLSSLWHWSSGHRLSLMFLCIGEAVIAGLGLAFTVATQRIIDAAVSQSYGRIKLYAFVIVGIILAQLTSGLILRYENIRITSVFRQKMRSMMISRVLGKQYSEIAGIHSGELTGKILTDTNTVVSAIVQIVPSLLFLTVQFLGAAIILFRYNPAFVLILIGICLVGAAFMAFVGNYMKQFHKDARTKEDQVLASVQETMQNLRIIKASEIEEHAKDKIWVNQEAFVAADLKRGKVSSAANTGIGFIFRFTWLYAMLWGCFGIFKGTISYGMLTAMLQLVGQIQSPISSLSGLVAQLYGAVSSAERLDELLNKQDEEETSESLKVSPKDMYSSLKEITVKDLNFSYDREQVLNNCNLTIKPGDITAIMGHSGCGKSTFFLLLMGLYKPSSGEICFSFTDGNHEDAGRLTRKMFSYVPQGNALFSGTLRENVTLFRKEATDAEIRKALSLACIEEFVETLDEGLETKLGEKGLGLSEGQAQRIALARAFLSDAPILLLDEATSALDEKTEAELLSNIASLKGKTCLIVTHRPAALKICTQQINFE